MNQKTEIVVDAAAFEDAHQIETIVADIVAIQEKIKNNKEVLKSYPIKSDPLRDMMAKRLVMNKAIAQEKERIKSDLLADKDFETATHEEKKLKNELKEKAAQLRLIYKNKHKVGTVYAENVQAHGKQLRLQLEFTPNVYLEGKPLK